MENLKAIIEQVLREMNVSSADLKEDVAAAVASKAACEGKGLEIPGKGITLDAPTPNKIIISGADKQVVGQIAAEIREKRPPEPYKGKGIKYVDEVIRRKEGKAGGKKK